MKPDYERMTPEQARRVRRGGMMLAQTVRGTARQKAETLVRDEAARQAVEEFGTRRQRRALQRARAAIAKRDAKIERARLDGVVLPFQLPKGLRRRIRQLERIRRLDAQASRRHVWRPLPPERA